MNDATALKDYEYKALIKLLRYLLQTQTAIADIRIVQPYMYPT